MLKCLAKGGGFIQGGRSKGIGEREPHHMLIVLSLFGKRVRHKITEKGMEGWGWVRIQPLEKLQSLCCLHLVLLLVFGNFPFLSGESESSNTQDINAGCRIARISLGPCDCVCGCECVSSSLINIYVLSPAQLNPLPIASARFPPFFPPVNLLF